MSNLEPKKSYPIDMTDREAQSLDQFIQDGLPGIATLTDDKVKKIFEMYMNGEPFGAISSGTGVKKNIVLYIAYKHGLYDMKMEMLTQMVEAAKTKANIVSLRSVDFLSDVMTGFENYYRDIFNRYRNSKMPNVVESASFENLKTYIKVLETLQKITNPQDDKGRGGINLNLPQGASFRKIDDKTIEVTPPEDKKDIKLSEILSTLAEIKKTREESQVRNEEEDVKKAKK